MSIATLIIIAFVLIFVIPKCIFIVPEGSVAMIYALGQYEKTLGAGVHFGWFDRGIRKKVILKIGSTGTMTSEETMDIGGYQIPVKSLDSTVPLGQTVRIQRFDGTIPFVTSSGLPNLRKVTCEKCGHQMEIRA